jgi:hypothetical protein
MEAELAFETSCFLKSFRWGGRKFLAVSHTSSSKPNVVEFYVNAGAWKSYRRVNQAACLFVLEASHIHNTFNRDSVRTDKAN